MPKIIISYRRSDTDAIAGRIRDKLAGYYGDESIFMDIDNIPFGTDFRAHIKDALHHSDIVIVIVGAKWTGPGKGKRTRIQEPTDPVRIEVETALQRGVPIVPVLVNSARMPTTADLPDSLADFAFRNAATVDTGRDFHGHMDRLIRALDGILKPKAPGVTPAVQEGVAASPATATEIIQPATPPPAPAPAAHSRGIIYAFAGAGVALAIAGAAFFSLFSLQEVPPPTPPAAKKAEAPPTPPATPVPATPVPVTKTEPPPAPVKTETPPVKTATPPAPPPATSAAACTSGPIGSINEAAVPEPGPGLRDAVKNGITPFFLCASGPIEQFARAFATISVVIAEFAPSASCFRGDGGAAMTQWSAHKTWADRQARTDLMLVNLRMKIDLAHACIEPAAQRAFYVEMARALASGMAGSSWSVVNPTIKGQRIDRCLNYARDCNEPAALGVCQFYGFTRVEKWAWEYVTPSITLGDRKVCPGNCGALTTITCGR